MSFADASPLINHLEVLQAERLVEKRLRWRVQAGVDEPAVVTHLAGGLAVVFGFLRNGRTGPADTPIGGRGSVLPATVR